jgi:hypothetical protein
MNSLLSTARAHVLMHVATRDVPHLGDDERLEIHDLGKGFEKGTPGFGPEPLKRVHLRPSQNVTRIPP